MKRIGIFGGTFDPPHIAHLIAAEHAFESFALDRLLFIPAKHSPLKLTANMSAGKHRVAMTRLAIEGNKSFEVSKIEINRPQPSYTIDTVLQLNEKYPKSELFLFIGRDQFLVFDTWKQYERILEACSVVVMKRPSISPKTLKSELTDRVQFLSIPQMEISSTEIRARVQKGKSIRYLVPDAVECYIQERGLYRT